MGLRALRVMVAVGSCSWGSVSLGQVGVGRALVVVAGDGTPDSNLLHAMPVLLAADLRRDGVTVTDSEICSGPQLAGPALAQAKQAAGANRLFVGRALVLGTRPSISSTSSRPMARRSSSAPHLRAR